MPHRVRRRAGPSGIAGAVLTVACPTAAGLPLGKTLADAAGGADGAAGASSASSSKHALPIMAGGQSWKVATAGADKNARVSHSI